MTDDSNGEHTKTVYAHYGLTMYLSQVLEHTIVNTLLFVDLLPNRAGKPIPRPQWEEEIDSFMDVHFEKTLGRMIHNLKAVIDTPEKLESLLSQALTKRNYLAHHFFREKAADFMTVHGRDRMIEELEEAQKLFEKVDNELEDVIRPLRERYGLSDEFVENHFREYIQKITGKR